MNARKWFKAAIKPFVRYIVNNHEDLVEAVATEGLLYEDLFLAYLQQGRGAYSWKQFIAISTQYERWGGGYNAPMAVQDKIEEAIQRHSKFYKYCKTRKTTQDRIVSFNPVLLTRHPGEPPVEIIQADKPDLVYDQISIPIHVSLISTIFANVKLQDPEFDFIEWFTNSYGKSIAETIDSLVISGDGKGKMTGILSVDLKQVSTELSNPDALNGQYLVDIYMNHPKRKSSIWIMNEKTGALLVGMEDGNGNPIVNMPQMRENNEVAPSSLFGRPIVYSADMPDVKFGSKPIMFSDLYTGYQLAYKGGFSARRFDDSNYAEHDETLLLVRIRIGGSPVSYSAHHSIEISNRMEMVS